MEQTGLMNVPGIDSDGCICTKLSRSEGCVFLIYVRNNVEPIHWQVGQ